jgi:PAS domain S-box-containing protein
MRHIRPKEGQSKEIETLRKRIQALETENQTLSRALTELGAPPSEAISGIKSQAGLKISLSEAISEVRGFVFQETDPRLLLDGVCRRWNEHVPCPIWIARTDAAGTEVLDSAAAGFPASLPPLLAPLAEGKPPESAIHALHRDGLALSPFPPPGEEGEPGGGAGTYAGWTQWTRPLADPDRVFGLLSFLLPPEIAEDRGASLLLSWLADDLAFALKTIAERNEFSWLHHIIVNSPHPLSFVSPDYRYEIVNQVYAEFFAVRREKIVGRSVAHFLGEEFFHAQIRPRLDRALDGETVHFETEANFPGRGKRWMEMRYIPHRNAAGRITGVFSYGMDVTLRKQVEKAQRENESRYRTHFVEFPIPLFVWHSQDGRFILLDGNLAANQIARGGLFRLLGTDARDLYAAEEAAHLLETLTRCFREKRTIQKEFRGHPKTIEPENWIRGTWVYLPPDLVVLHIEDITARKTAETALRESEKRFQLAMEASRDGLWDWDVPTDALYTSSGYARLLGYNPLEIPGTVAGWEAIVPPEDWKTVAAVHDACIENRTDHFTLEFRVLAKNGTLRWIRGQGKAVERDATGRALRLVGTHTDITERKTEEERRARLEAKMHQTQKMESIGRLAGGVAHDLNNLLSPILGYSEMLLSECAPEDARAELLAEIEQAGLRGRDLVRRLLTFSRKQNLEVQPVNLNHLLTNFQKLLRRTIREDVAIEMRLDPAPPTLEGDPGQLEQVIMNLAVNAQDAMPEGGRLVLETGRSAPPANGCGRTETAPVAPPWVRLRVGDTGQGMSPEIQAQIFEPFFTTKEKDQGTGLGLSTVYGIVRRHGGEIRVCSRPGEGTEFSVFLPVPEKPVPAAVPVRHRNKKEDLRGTETVLVVEDDPPVRRLVRDFLSRRGYRVVATENGRHALETLSRRGGPVHLVITDVVMPEMNGPELFAEISRRYPHIRVLFMSGYTEEVTARHGIDASGINFIQKPFTVNQLAEKIRAVLSP